MDFHHAGSFTHSALRLSCPWGRDPWGTRNISFVSCPYSFPQHCMSYRLSVGAGLFTNLFWLVIKTHERVYWIFLVHDLVPGFVYEVQFEWLVAEPAHHSSTVSSEKN